MRLSDFISENLEPILNEWEQYAKGIRAAQGMSSEELRDHAKRMLETVALDLQTPQTEAEQKEKSKGHRPTLGEAASAARPSQLHAALRAQAGFSIAELISEYRALRASVLRLWGKCSDAVQQSDLDDMLRFNEAIDQSVAEAVDRYSEIVSQAQDLFLGILSHDLRNPLGAVIMSAQFLMQDAALDSRYIKAASIIYNSGNQMHRLIDDLLDFTRTRLGKSMPIARGEMDLAQVVGQTVAEASAFHPDRKIAFDAIGDLSGRWDSARIGQVFSNLIGNAIKYGSEEPITVILAGGEQEVLATVHNGGKPIPASEIAHVFQPLYRVTGPSDGNRPDFSLGLGLYITHEIVAAHGGTIELASSTAMGTTFTVRLPRQLAAG
ncbi:MAG: ATP-binding protein [Massilia sp.]